MKALSCWVNPSLSFEHLLSQPGVAVDVDLDGEREPSRQPDVDQAQVGIEEVEVEHALRPACVDQAGAVLGVGQLEAGAAFHAAEDADQPFADRPLSQKLVDELILAVGALEVVVLGAGLLGQALGVIDQGFGLFLSEIHEVAASNLEDVVDEPFESRSVGDGQIALEDDAVKAREHGDDQVGKLGDEARQRLHGVLLRVGTTSNPILAGERCFCSSFLVAASPR